MLDRSELPLAERLDDALTQFRHRLELHLDQQSRLQRSYRGWYGRWTHQCQRMTRQMAILEGLLQAWMPEPERQEGLRFVSRNGEHN
jgi:hypothetical protein